MSEPQMLYNLLKMDLENLIPIQAKRKVEIVPPGSHLATSEKIRYMLSKFPSPQPARPNVTIAPSFGPSFDVCKLCMAANCNKTNCLMSHDVETRTETLDDTSRSGSTGKDILRVLLSVVRELLQLIQVALTASALILYYVMYGWAQFVYTGLHMAVFFHKADGPLKVTLGVVGVTTFIVGFNLLVRLQKLFVGNTV